MLWSHSISLQVGEGFVAVLNYSQAFLTGSVGDTVPVPV